MKAFCQLTLFLFINLWVLSSKVFRFFEPKLLSWHCFEWGNTTVSVCPLEELNQNPELYKIQSTTLFLQIDECSHKTEENAAFVDKLSKKSDLFNLYFLPKDKEKNPTNRNLIYSVIVQTRILTCLFCREDFFSNHSIVSTILFSQRTSHKA